MERVRTFAVGENFTLRLEDIFSQVIIETSDRSDVEVQLEGDEELLKGLTIGQISPVELMIREDNTSVGGSVVISGNSISVSGSFISGSMIVAGGKVVVNGKDVTEDASGVHVTKIPVKITVLVPAGCNLDISSCNQLKATGKYGSSKVRADGQGDIEIDEVASANLRSGGQSSVVIHQVNSGSKPLRLESSGQSSLTVTGVFGDVEANSSGQSSIRLHGNCESFEADTSGQSRIFRSGSVNGTVRERSTGQSKIHS